MKRLRDRLAAFLPAAALAAATLLPVACASPKPLTPWAASERAAALANEKCQERYGTRPFTAEDFEAIMEGGRWTWGAAGERPIDGFAVEVSFEPDGRRPAVQVHRDEHLGNPEGL